MMIKIPFKTPTVNLMYVTWSPKNSIRTMRIKSKEAKLLAEEVKKIVDNLEIKETPEELEINIEIHSNWYNKDGTIKKRDIANLEKFITDSIFNALPNMDDKQIFEISMKKIQDTEEFALVIIKEFQNEK